MIKFVLSLAVILVSAVTSSIIGAVLILSMRGFNYFFENVDYIYISDFWMATIGITIPMAIFLNMVVDFFKK